MHEEPAIAEIAKLEAARYRAMLDGDAARLEPLLAHDLLYTHSNAQSDSKAQYLEKLRSGFVRYKSIAAHDEAIRLLGDTAALVTGRMTAEIEMAGTSRSLNNLYAVLWQKRGDGWQLILYQPTPLPAPVA